MDAESWNRAEAAFTHVTADGPAGVARAMETITRTDPEMGRRLQPVIDAYLTHTAGHAGAGSAPRPDKVPGERVGRYVILGLVGRGGMGAVYRAHDPQIGRVVALKILHAHDERFLSEVRAAGTLAHPNIVTIYDCAQIDGEFVIVMEFIEGRTIDELLRKGRVGEVGMRLQLLRQLCSTLDYAHDRGIVHRDIKPANLMVDRAGRLRVLDFGIARIGQPSRQFASVIIGTLRYMSPEQMSGREVDRRSDIFAVGVVAYELLSYRHPFERSTAVELAYAIAFESPEPLKKLVPILDPRLVAIVSRALEKNPADRYVTLSEMFEDLARIEDPWRPGSSRLAANERRPEPPPVRHALLSPYTWLALVIPVIAAIAVTAVMLRRPPDAAAAGRWFETGARLVGLGDPSRLDEGLRLLQRSCDAGDVRGCQALGSVYEAGTVVARDAARATALYTRACNYASVGGCVRLAAIHRGGSRDPENQRAATAASLRACELGSVAECNYAGVSYVEGTGVLPDRAKGTSLLSRACEHQSAVACVNLARIALGAATIPDPARVIALLERGCSLGAPDGCVQAAEILASGRGIPADAARASQLQARAAQLRANPAPRGPNESAAVLLPADGRRH